MRDRDLSGLFQHNELADDEHGQAGVVEDVVAEIVPRTYSNILLYWTFIQMEIAQRLTVFDCGRSTRGAGPYRFKRQWGAQAGSLCWEYRLLNGEVVPDLTPRNPKFVTATAVWKHLPERVASWLGPPVVRHIP